jgi:hypothetical protein
MMRVRRLGTRVVAMVHSQSADLRLPDHFLHARFWLHWKGGGLSEMEHVEQMGEYLSCNIEPPSPPHRHPNVPPPHPNLKHQMQGPGSAKQDPDHMFTRKAGQNAMVDDHGTRSDGAARGMTNGAPGSERPHDSSHNSGITETVEGSQRRHDAGESLAPPRRKR